MRGFTVWTWINISLGLLNLGFFVVYHTWWNLAAFVLIAVLTVWMARTDRRTARLDREHAERMRAIYGRDL